MSPVPVAAPSAAAVASRPGTGSASPGKSAAGFGAALEEAVGRTPAESGAGGRPPEEPVDTDAGASPDAPGDLRSAGAVLPAALPFLVAAHAPAGAPVPAEGASAVGAVPTGAAAVAASTPSADATATASGGWFASGAASAPEAASVTPAAPVPAIPVSALRGAGTAAAGELPDAGAAVDDGAVVLAAADAPTVAESGFTTPGTTAAAGTSAPAAPAPNAPAAQPAARLGAPALHARDGDILTAGAGLPPAAAALDAAGRPDPQNAAAAQVPATTAPPALPPDAAPVAGIPAPTGPATPAPAPVAAPPPAPAAAPPPLPQQLAAPILDLQAAAPGEHIITVRVAPENLGPVTVRAQVTADGMTVELFAPTDQARDALKAILPDLRRDLAQSGAGTSVGLGAGDSGAGSRDERREQQPERTLQAFTVPAPVPSGPRAVRSADPRSVLDVLA
ncbi:flagellar hook-length control protein FliK [Naasia sp. SYSU D00948]|uniref:flagellar hook-length control protein FliK n=1 Tax=Naasia sp. SYSU D00948 TaxID=2817379 RepID=UPI001B3128AB|nr:flagellar hook-length control protein FliK [Naasia sp. SYSU D00948]